MASPTPPELISTVALEPEPGSSGDAVAPFPLALPAPSAETPVARPGDRRGSLLRRLLLIADVTALCQAFVVIELAVDAPGSVELPLALLGIPLWVLLAYGHRLYHLDSFRADFGASDELGPVLQMATLWGWGGLLALPLLGHEQVHLAPIVALWGLAVVLLMSLRWAARAFARGRPWYSQDALVVGPSDEVEAIVRKLARHPEWAISPLPHVEGVDPDALVAMVRRSRVDRVMLAPAWTESCSRVELVSELAELGVHVDLVPSWSDVVGSRLQLHEIEGMPLLTVPRASLGQSSMYLKRAFDLMIGSLAILLLAPLLTVCAIAIRLDSPGPVLFRQRRVGRGDKRFYVFKFRSMCDDADLMKREVAELNLHGGGVEAGMFKIRRDPRVTRVGRILRRYSLDELPQLFNVIRGEMSLVGPRPLIESEDSQVVGRFRRRLGITPGLTGLWQVNGRSEIPFKEMVSLDYLYVTNWSLWGDVKLLMRTVSVVLRGRGAY